MSLSDTLFIFEKTKVCLQKVDGFSCRFGFLSSELLTGIILNGGDLTGNNAKLNAISHYRTSETQLEIFLWNGIRTCHTLAMILKVGS